MTRATNWTINGLMFAVASFAVCNIVWGDGAWFGAAAGFLWGGVVARSGVDGWIAWLLILGFGAIAATFIIFVRASAL